jgi:phosphoglycolate phosphatase-like HAD superfamily hydrolase
MERTAKPEVYVPFPGVEVILQQTHSNFIVTHNSRSEVDKVLHYYGWDNYFHQIIAREDGYQRKPDEKAYLAIHTKYPIHLVIGDRELDILPARKLGIKSCIFRNPSVLGADYYINNYQEFRAYLPYHPK